MPAWGVKFVQDTITVKLRGFRREMPRKVTDETLKVGKEMENYAKSIVPVRTGYLRSTIAFRAFEAPLMFWFGATAYYASYVEFGTWKMMPEPYLRPALDAYIPKIMAAIKNGVWTVMR